MVRDQLPAQVVKRPRRFTGAGCQPIGFPFVALSALSHPGNMQFPGKQAVRVSRGGWIQQVTPRRDAVVRLDAPEFICFFFPLESVLDRSMFDVRSRGTICDCPL